MTYHDRLDQFNLHTLEIRRCEASLNNLNYKMFFPDHIFKYMSTPRHHITSLTLLFQIFYFYYRTNSFTYSFVPYTIILWNNLDYATANAPSVQSFEYLVDTSPSISTLLFCVFVYS